MSRSVSATSSVVRNELEREPFNRGVIEYLPEAERLLSAADRASLEEIQVTVEEPWSQRIEATLRIWLDEATASGKAHSKSAFILKRRYRLLSFINIFWSAVILIANNAIGCNADAEAKFALLVINAIGFLIASLVGSLNYGSTYRIHFEYDTKYFELAQDIEYMLMRDIDYRIPADTFMMEIKERRKRLAEAPELAGSKFFGC
jgi:hypothetical protein